MIGTGAGTSLIAVDHIDGVALVTISNPPLNALSQVVRQCLLDTVRSIAEDPQVRAAVISGAGRAFVAGADVREFEGPLREPSLPEVLQVIDNMQKPVVAAIDGVALGGGAELALACHARIATDRSSFGFPEVKLGIIPGAAGIPRLIRLVNPAEALDLIATGRCIDARTGVDIGVFTAAVKPSQLLGVAVELARSLAVGPLCRVSNLPVRDWDADVLDRVAKRLLSKARGQQSIVEAVNAVCNAVTQDFKTAAADNRESFLALRISDQARALRHLFFAEREAQKIPGVEPMTARSLGSVAIVGAGTMGRGIAAACLAAGYPTVLIDHNSEVIENAKSIIADNVDRIARNAKWEAGRRETMLTSLATSSSVEAVAGQELIIEAVFEDLAVKQRVLTEIDRYGDADAIIATNTSYLNTDLLAQSVRHAERFIGLHFFAPAEIMRIVEVVRGERSDTAVVATALKFAKSLGKLAIVSEVCEGFIVNRILARYRREMEFLLEDGALPQEIDTALETFGMAMGPFAVADLSGLDIAWARRKRLAATRDTSERYVMVPDWLCEMGRFGRKAGVGWYRYENGKRLPDPLVQSLVEKASAERGITRLAISAEKITLQAIEAMADEARKILAEGIALRASDIDLAIVHGLGFPAWRGGPLFHTG